MLTEPGMDFLEGISRSLHSDDDALVRVERVARAAKAAEAAAKAAEAAARMEAEDPESCRSSYY